MKVCKNCGSRAMSPVVVSLRCQGGKNETNSPRSIGPDEGTEFITSYHHLHFFIDTSKVGVSMLSGPLQPYMGGIQLTFTSAFRLKKRSGLRRSAFISELSPNP